jgi:outer membrane protein
MSSVLRATLERRHPVGWTGGILPPAHHAAAGSRRSSRLEGGAPFKLGPTIALAFALAIGVLLPIAEPARAQTLDDAIVRALAHSPDLRALEASVAEARANATLANPFTPSASIATTPGYATGLPTAVLGQLPAIGTVEAHRLLYDPTAHAERLNAQAEVDAAVARLELRRREIAQGVAELYGRLVAGEAILASAQRRVAANETIAARTEALEKEGRARDLDVDRAALQLAVARRREAQARAHYELDRTRYGSLVGEVWSAPPQAPPPAATSDESAAAESGEVAAALAADPELRAFDVRIETLQRALVATSSFWQPSVAAQVQYSRLFDRFGRYYNHFTPNDLSIGASVTLPLWTGGRRAATSARVAAQLEQLKAEREARRSQLDLALREATADVREATAESEMARRTREVAQKGLRVAEELAREGRGDPNDVPAAEIALADAEDEGSNAAAHLTAVVARLKLLRGELPHPPI